MDNKLFQNKVLLVIVIALFVVLLGFGITKLINKKTNNIQISKDKIENNFAVLDSLFQKKDSVFLVLDSSEIQIIQALKDYKEFIKANHYEEDSAYVYINSVHIDTLLSRLPRFNEEQ